MQNLLRVGFSFLLFGAIGVALGDEPSRDERPITDAEEKAKLLEVIALEMRANYERIETWSGVYSFSDWGRTYGENPSIADNGLAEKVWQPVEQPIALPEVLARKDSRAPGFWRLSRGEVRFAIEQASGRIHTFVDASEPAIFVDVPSGKQMVASTPGVGRHWIVTADELLEHDIRETKGELSGFPATPWLSRRGNRIVYRRPSTLARKNTLSFDPRDCFVEGRFSASKVRTLWGNCERHAAWARRPEYAPRVEIIQLQASPPIYSHAFTSKDGMKSRWTYDGSVGFNVTDSSQFQDDRLTWQRTATFRKFDEILIPESFEVVFTREEPDKKPSVSFFRSVTLKSTTLNQPIDAKEFGIKQLSLAYGDRMVDEIKSQLLIYDGNGFVPVEQFTVDKSRLEPAKTLTPQSKKDEVPNAPPRGNRFLIALNGLIMLAFIGFYLYQRSKRSRSPS